MDNLSNRIKKLKFKMIELADYLDVSRATIYRYVEAYETDHSEDIPKLPLKVFDLIMEHPDLRKIDIIYYINELKTMKIQDESLESLITKMGDYIKKNPDSMKTKFMISAFSSNKLDDAIDFIMHLAPYLDDAGNQIEGGMFENQPSDSYFFWHAVCKRRRRIGDDL